MALTPGIRLGAYEIVSAIGAGGMGEVYRARDTRLKRDVALKILPESFATDTERLARFQREAEVLASLNHPNIAHIYGLEESNGTRALVMELVEGPTLADRIAQGPIPVDEALPIARQIAEALEAAHERGIIHRDLKPANIKVRPDGTVKVLDFGLAKALEPMSARTMDATASPTITSPAMMTGVGMLLGTAGYMSPEQARGKAVDKRSDIWAFGCVLYEMLTARSAFTGEDVSETLAAVLKEQPDWSALPIDTPSSVRRLLRRSLEKDRSRRLSDIGDARLELEDAFTTRDDVPEMAVRIPLTRATKWRQLVPWAIAFGTGATLLLTWQPWRAPDTPFTQRVSIELGADVPLREASGTSLAISPDGTMIAFSGGNNVSAQLYLRQLGRLQAVALVPDVAGDPFFSPDSRWVGFISYRDRKLKKMPVAGGVPAAIADVQGIPPRGASWGDDGFIVFSPSPLGGPLLRVSAAGGSAESITELRNGEVAHRYPQVLPGAKALLFTALNTNNDIVDAKVVAQTYPAGAAKVLVQNAYFGRYVPTGHLLYIQRGVLFAVPFDVDRLELTGEAVSIVDGVVSLTESGAAWFDVSRTGTLAYVPGAQRASEAMLLWARGDGTLTPMRDAPFDWRHPQFSPDGHRLAFNTQERGQTDVWVYDGLVRR